MRSTSLSCGRTCAVGRSRYRRSINCSSTVQVPHTCTCTPVGASRPVTPGRPMTRFAREVAPGRIRRCGLESSLDGSGPRSKCITVYISSCPHPLLMLAPRASSAFVCLRCELKLARPRISPLASQSSHASFSTSARRQDGADETQTQTQKPMFQKGIGRVMARNRCEFRRSTLGRVDYIGRRSWA